MRASVSSEEIASAKISCSERSLKFLATAFSLIRILFFPQRRIGVAEEAGVTEEAGVAEGAGVADSVTPLMTSVSAETVGVAEAAAVAEPPGVAEAADVA